METAQIPLHLKERFLYSFAGSLGAADSGLVAAAVADLGSDTAADLRAVQMLATAVEAHLLHHQIHRDLQETQRSYADRRTIRDEL